MANDQSHADFFSEFAPSTKEEWRKKIASDLKGKDSEKLTWKSPDGIEVSPIYTSEDLDNLQYLDNQPGTAPFNRGVKINNNNWLIHQCFKLEKLKETNHEIRTAIKAGVKEIEINTEKAISIQEVEGLLTEINPEEIQICFNTGNNPVELMKILVGYFKEKDYKLANISGSIEYDPFGQALLNQNSPGKDLIKEIAGTEQLLLGEAKDLPLYRLFNVSGNLASNAGASIPQELGIALAMGSEYFAIADDSGIPASVISAHMQMILGIGSNYFMEISKIRAARLLWSTMLNTYDKTSFNEENIYIRSVPTLWNKTKMDPYVNMLRYTTEALSAALGGANSIGSFPFNMLTKKPGSFSQRIARNTQVILKNEAYIDKIIDPAAGSYYIENMTDAIAKQAWEFFKEIEKRGGFLKSLEEKFIQEELIKTQNKRKMNIANRKEILVGTNHYPDYLEQYPQDELSTVANVTYWLNQRGAESFENLRKITRKNKIHRPIAVLFPFGNTAIRTTRTIFSSNFFGCGGFLIKDLTGMSSIEEGIQQCVQAKPDVIVFCSADKDYADKLPSIINRLKNTPILVVAGYPKDQISSLEKQGINYFIHIKSNVLETLTWIQKELGVFE
ncbi:MAG: hypothetical protein J7L04_04670 [Bacteroidales bacterium]|nr:hypothetical protein [Bacteroidales bacterium]